MKNILLPFAAAVLLAGSLPFALRAQSQPSRSHLGAEKSITDFDEIEVKNFQDESLGRIKDLGIDLVNGRIVEVLIASDSSLDVDGKIVAVPPLALMNDPANKVYRLNVSTDVFKTAAAVNLKKWQDEGSSDRVAAAYHLFGQETYFLETGDPAPAGERRPKVSLGYVERSSKILDLPVGNLQSQPLGKVWSMTLDIPHGRILTVIVLAPGNFKTKSIVPAPALSFNAERNALLLDDSKIEFADEPRYVFTEEAYGQKAYSREESYKGPHTAVPLEQGNSYRDIDRTLGINRDIRTARINGRHVQVGTMNGRVTLCGWVVTAVDKQRIGDIAIAASRLELVDNQITVGAPAAVQ